MNFALFRVRGNRVVQIAKALMPPVLWAWLFRHLVIKDIPNAYAYDPHYQPWREPMFLKIYQSILHRTCCPPDSVYILTALAQKSLRLPGQVMEAGVWKGGTAKVLLGLIRAHSKTNDKTLFLFDSFEGMKNTNSDMDRHRVGDFADTSLESVQQFLGSDNIVQYRKGWVPETFINLDDQRFCFAHIDLDLYQSVKDCLEFVYPRMSHGGIIVLDDYGYASCPGAKKAVDEFLADKPEKVLPLHTAQGIIFIS